MDGIAAAVEGQLQSGGNGTAADAGATASASVTGNHLELSIIGASGTHSIRFGSAGDSSNALSILGLSGQTATAALNPTITGSTELGVVRTSTALDGAGLTGLTSTTTGKLSINGVDIAYNTTTDSLSTVIGRINASSAGVIATLDRANDRIVLTRKVAGAIAIDVHDTSGTLGSALKLAPDTTNAQVIGESAQVIVDGRTVTSDTNHVTNAIDGVSLDLLGLSDAGTATTLTVGVDRTGITAAINDFIKSFNALGDQLDKLTVNTPGTDGKSGTKGPLATDWTVQSMYLDLRSTVTQAVAGLTGSLTSLADVGISTGPIGSGGKRLVLDGARLGKALDQDPARVASLLDDTAGALKPLLDRLNAINGPKGIINGRTEGIASAIRSLDRQQADEQERIDAAQASYEARFAALEGLLAQLQTQSSSLSSQVASMNGKSS
jgi:flagellar hook-associated protein 2